MNEKIEKSKIKFVRENSYQIRVEAKPVEEQSKTETQSQWMKKAITERERENLNLGILVSFTGEQSQFAQINKGGTRSI